MIALICGAVSFHWSHELRSIVSVLQWSRESKLNGTKCLEESLSPRDFYPICSRCSSSQRGRNGTEGVRGIEADGMFKSKWMLQEITKAFNLDVGYFETRTRRLQAAIFL